MEHQYGHEDETRNSMAVTNSLNNTHERQEGLPWVRSVKREGRRLGSPVCAKKNLP
jgi:hypothetical protein